jgi:hypothetical protein
MQLLLHLIAHVLRFREARRSQTTAAARIHMYMTNCLLGTRTPSRALYVPPLIPSLDPLFQDCDQPPESACSEMYPPLADALDQADMLAEDMCGVVAR